MTVEFALVLAFQAILLGVFVFLFTRLENRVDRLSDRVDQLSDHLDQLGNRVNGDVTGLRKDLAEEFRAQRAEVAAQITAITNAILATRRGD
jgi:uncharacterized protein YPO0396